MPTTSSKTVFAMRDGRVRITAQFVRTADQTHFWAETYEREMVQLLPLENEVAA